MPPGQTVRQLDFLVGVDDRATRKLLQIDAVADQLGDGVEATAAQLDMLGAAVKGFGAAAIGASAAVAALAWQGSKLSKPMSIIQSTTNATQETMTGLRNEIQRIGAETPVTVKQAADAFKELSYAGLETQEIFAAGQDVVELAVAGNLNMGESAKIAAQNMNAFNLEANQVSSVADTLAATFASSATEVNQLANGLSYVNATASQLGFSMTETTATLGTLADNAIAGTRAGTSLNQAFAKLFAQTGKVERSLDAVGLSIQDFIDKEGDTKDMLTIFETLKDRMDELNLSDAGQTAFLTDVFGRRGARAIQPLLSSLDNLREKQQQASFAQFKSQLTEVRDMSSEKLINLEQALFGDQDQELDILGMAPTQDEVFGALRERYGAGGGAAAQVQAALENAFPDMEDFAIEQVAETLTATGDEISDAQIEDAFEETEKSAAQLRKEMTDTELAMAVANDTFREATTDAEIYEEYIDSVGGALRYIKGSLSVVADEMFLGLRPALMAVLKSGMKFLDWLRNQPELLQSMGRALGVVAVGASAAATAFGALYAAVSVKLLWMAHGAMLDLVTSGGMLGGVFTKAAGVLGKFKSVLVGIPKTLAAIVAGGDTLGKSLATLLRAGAKVLAPFRALVAFLGGPLTVALALAGSALAFWITDFNNFREKVKPFTNALGGAAEGAMNFAGAIMDVTGWALGGLTDHLGGPATGALETFADALAWVLSELGYIIKFLTRTLHYLGRFVDILGTGFLDLLRRDFDALGNKADEFMQMIDNIIAELDEVTKFKIQWPEPPDWLKPLLGDSEYDEGGNGEGGGDHTLPGGGGMPSAAGHGQNANTDQARKAGEAEQRAYAKGKQEGKKHVAQAQKDTAAASAAYMGSSDAKKGPLSNITDRGAGVMRAYSKGMRRARHTATTAAKGSMGAIARRLGPDGLREKGDSTFRKLADQIERIHEPLETGNDLLETGRETVKDLLGRLRQFRNFRLNLSNVTNPLSAVHGWLTDNIGGVDSLTDWIAGLELMDPTFSGIKSALNDVLGLIDDIITDAGEMEDELSEPAEDSRFGDEDQDHTTDENPPSSTGQDQNSDRRDTNVSTPSVGSVLGKLVPETEPAEESRFGDEDQDHTLPENPPGPTGQDQNSDDDEDDDEDDDGGSSRLGGTGGMGPGQFPSMGMPSAAMPQGEQTATDRVMRAASHAIRGPGTGPQPTPGGGTGGQQDGQQAATSGAGGGEGSAGGMARYRAQAGQRAQQAAQPFMPQAYNAFRSGLIPSFVPTLGDSSGGGDGTGTDDTGGADTPQGSDDEGGPGGGDDTEGEDGDGTEGGDDTGGADTPQGGDDATANTMGTASAGAGGPNVTVEDQREVNVDNSGGDTDQLREELLRELNASNERLVDDIIRSMYADADTSGGSGSGGAI